VSAILHSARLVLEAFPRRWAFIMSRMRHLPGSITCSLFVMADAPCELAYGFPVERFRLIPNVYCTPTTSAGDLSMAARPSTAVASGVASLVVVLGS
jgi:hypothetical protein